MALKNTKIWANTCTSSWQKVVIYWKYVPSAAVEALLFERWTTRWDKIPLSCIKMNNSVLTGKGTPQRGCTETVLV